MTRKARQSEQRERLVEWMAEAYRKHGERLTVHDVISGAGVGRNTFYEYFDGLEHGLGYASQTLLKRMYEQSVTKLDTARTPIARLRVLSRVWFELLVVEPAGMALLSRRAESRAVSPAGELFGSLLRTALGLSVEGLERLDDGRELCAAFAAEGAALAVQREGADPEVLQEALSLILQRVFR